MSTPITTPGTTLKTAALLAFSALAASAAVKAPILQPAQQRQQPSATQHTTSHAVTAVGTTTVLSITTGLLISYGVTVDGIAHVQATDNSQLTGTITFYDGATSICTTSVIGPAACPPNAGSGFATGKHNLTAVYGGDATHAASTSNIATVTVVPDTTTASLTSSANPATIGQPVILTATLTGNITTPVGTVTFFDSGTVLGTGTLDSNGRATLTTSTLTAGTHALTVAYAATQNFQVSTSPVISQIIVPASNAAATAIMISSSANPALAGQSITLTANVVTATPSALIPTGTVTFLETTASGNTPLGTATLNSNGLATLTTSTLTTGTHSITASYAGNAAFAASLSSTVLQVINAPTTTVSPSFIIGAGATSIPTGAAANVLVKVSPINGFNQPVQLTCANLPTEASCTFAGTVIPAGGGSTTLKLTTLAPRACGSATPYGQTPSGASASLLHGASTLATSTFAVPSLAGLLLFLLPKRRRALKSLLTLIAMCGAIALTGCGACTDLGTRPGTYTFQVTGTSMGATHVTVTQNIQVTVTE